MAMFETAAEDILSAKHTRSLGDEIDVYFCVMVFGWLRDAFLSNNEDADNMHHYRSIRGSPHPLLNDLPVHRMVDSIRMRETFHRSLGELQRLGCAFSFVILSQSKYHHQEYLTRSLGEAKKYVNFVISTDS